MLRLAFAPRFQSISFFLFTSQTLRFFYFQWCSHSFWLTHLLLALIHYTDTFFMRLCDSVHWTYTRDRLIALCIRYMHILIFIVSRSIVNIFYESVWIRKYSEFIRLYIIVVAFVRSFPRSLVRSFIRSFPWIQSLLSFVSVMACVWVCWSAAQMQILVHISFQMGFLVLILFLPMHCYRRDGLSRTEHQSNHEFPSTHRCGTLCHFERYTTGFNIRQLDGNNEQFNIFKDGHMWTSFKLSATGSFFRFLHTNFFSRSFLIHFLSGNEFCFRCIFPYQNMIEDERIFEAKTKFRGEKKKCLWIMFDRARSASVVGNWKFQLIQTIRHPRLFLVVYLHRSPSFQSPRSMHNLLQNHFFLASSARVWKFGEQRPRDDTHNVCSVLP